MFNNTVAMFLTKNLSQASFDTLVGLGVLSVVGLFGGIIMFLVVRSKYGGTQNRPGFTKQRRWIKVVYYYLAALLAFAGLLGTVICFGILGSSSH